MKINNIITHLETIAPLAYQEGYDNAGLIVGNRHTEATSALLCLDAIECVIDEAIEMGCNLVIAHHPIIFKGLKKLTGSNYIERVIIKAIKNDIAIYAAHTNLDSVHNGVNAKICERLKLQNCTTLAPKKGQLLKLFTFCPEAQAAQVRDALFEAGAGKIGNYSECSFNTHGLGSFRAGPAANPFVGSKEKRSVEPEVKIEVLFSKAIQSRVIAALQQSHPYEEVAYDIVLLENEQTQVGAGMIGELQQAMEVTFFLEYLKDKMKTSLIRHTQLLSTTVKRIAVCGGAGSFLLPQAIAAQADVFVTGDFRYHSFFDAEDKIVIADIGHYESEQFTTELFAEILKQEFPNFATRITRHITNPINYF